MRKKTLVPVLFLLVSALNLSESYSQSVAINNDGSPPNANTMLHVKYQGGDVNSLGLRVTQAGLGQTARFDVTNSNSSSTIVRVENPGLGQGLVVSSTNTSNTSSTFTSATGGTGTAITGSNTNDLGLGSGGVFTKSIPHPGPYSGAVGADLEVRHKNLTFDGQGLTGFRIFNASGIGSSWTFYTANVDGNLLLYAKGDIRGSFNSATGVYTPLSDARFKSAIVAMPSLLSKVMQLQPKAYNYTNDKNRKNVFGFLAQDVETLFPQAVYKNKPDNGGEDFYTMDYSAFGVIAIKAIQEQQKIIEEQNKKIDALTKVVEELLQKSGNK